MPWPLTLWATLSTTGLTVRIDASQLLTLAPDVESEQRESRQQGPDALSAVCNAEHQQADGARSHSLIPTKALRRWCKT